MKLSLKLLCLFLFCISASQIEAQTNSKTSGQVADEKITLCKELENTYQVIAENNRIKLSLTSDLCEIVKRERKADKTVYYKYSDLISLKIYSEAELKTISKPLQYIIYKEN